MSLYKGFRTLMLVVVFGGIGILIGMIVETLYNEGIIIDEYVVGSILISDLKFYLLLIFIILGICIAYVRSR